MEAVFAGSLELKRKVLRSVDRPIDAMTVADICARSGISRQTFYKHFKSKYDIAYWYLSLGEDLYLYEIGRTLSLEAGLRAFFSFLYEERSGLAFAFEPNPSKREVRHRLERPMSEFAWTLQTRGVEVTGDVLFCLSFLVESANCLVASWCLHGLDEEPDVVARRLALCVPAVLLQALNDKSADLSI